MRTTWEVSASTRWLAQVRHVSRWTPAKAVLVQISRPVFFQAT
jgi:hypothetical protein